MSTTPPMYALLALRDRVIFPHGLAGILVGRPFSLQAVREALTLDEPVLLAYQRDPEESRPSRPEYFHPVAVLARIVQYATAPDGTMRILVHGIERLVLDEMGEEGGVLRGNGQPFPWTDRQDLSRLKALMQVSLHFLERILEEHVPLPDPVGELLNQSLEELEPEVFLGVMGTHFPGLDYEERLALLARESLEEALDRLAEAVARYAQLVDLQHRIQVRAQEALQQGQKEYFLQQQMREIQRELGMGEESELEELRRQIQGAGMPDEVREKALKELDRLARIPPASPESGVIRTYLDWLIALPWSTTTPDLLDLDRVEAVLNEDHYGLEEPKERILEYLSAVKLKGRVRGQVICFVGPPGVGKTSLARSIARALGRKFVRISLGGVRDEAEIRGHRRTYVGALPGRIIQQIRRAGTRNPVFLLDEVDKMGADWRGDPYAALMEVLDPELNHAFQDHYLEVDFDLSDVLFITTANNPYAIPGPLRDRMELIPVRGYLETEKFMIAKKHLLPRQYREVSLPEGAVRITDGALRRLIAGYTREAGVRDLERTLRRVLLKAARRYLKGEERIRISVRDLPELLGPPKYDRKERDRELMPGVAHGLAWTEYGGDLLRIEVAVFPGKGNLLLTGSLGDVMRESAMAALSYVRQHTRTFGIPSDFYEKVDLHVHVPEGAIPKDGPSAGVAIAVAMISALTRITLPAHVAMTGEITLTGKVLGVGGLPEKLMAARRFGLRVVYLPEVNRPDVERIPAEVREGLELRYVRRLDPVVRDLFPPSRRPRMTDEPPQEYRRWVQQAHPL
ncbi:MAG: endopeptidase La [Candidatus Hydrothermae bacterium]|nr:endopeptidase La [Candidatus Hydrothermae bacterium]